MLHQQYVIWRVGPQLKFKVAGKVHTIEWSMNRERELQTLMARWMEEISDVE